MTKERTHYPILNVKDVTPATMLNFEIANLADEVMSVTEVGQILANQVRMH